ncbi:M28 family metallopeptidase [Planctomyces sp. SH-PL62]|uniref:M28 family metallopeptidase n=1 Tax=Planctomyces sp. SH-PL62 TaxID=1636152 RepID=UPI00078BEC19|nr:M28 family metallopeptidase [Planctomyces sp. SH-PL62]AMV36703.1 Aminopeptidase S [Planctomyces sp. SH-PL62]
MRKSRRPLVLAALSLLATAPGRLLGDEPPPPIGFAPASLAAHRVAEARATAVPTPVQARRWLRTLTAEPHPAGTPADERTATFVRDRLREWGWSAEIVPYEVLLNYPSAPPTLALDRPEPLDLDLEEKPIADDKDSANSAAFPAFHGYGISGTASGQVVYANYGRPEDFKALEGLGIDVRDKVVLCRYGAIFRGLKVLNAQRRGAKGILIYSDPGDDGFAKGDVYPDGPFRPESAVQRGSVLFLSLSPGDPSTPHGPSIPGADRLPFDARFGFPLQWEEGVETWEKKTGLKRAEYFATIPSLPIGYGAANEILTRLAGANAPGGWQGGLPVSYHVGPGPAELTMTVSTEYKVRTIWNVIAKLPGAVEPDRWVMLGNHRDAWVHGAVDPGSGTAATLEACRTLGQAVKDGWKPRRTVVYASWDAEEYGLVGSTEWAEQFADEVDRKAALMLNVDSAVSGPDLDMGGVPSLRDLVLGSAAAVTDPRSGRSLRDGWLEARRAAWVGSSPLVLTDPFWARDGEAPAPSGFVPQLAALGSGSDYTAFLDHLGVPALDVGFEGRYGVYHSIYDDFAWMEKHGDPEFLTHATAAKLYVTILMRAAGADVLPFRFTPYADALRSYVDDLRLLRARQARKAPAPTADEGFEGLTTLADAVLALGAEAKRLDEALDALGKQDGARPEKLEALNEALARIERAFLLPDGLAGRPWFKHAVYAPGLTTGYACWPLPAVREAIETDKPEQLKTAVPATTQALARAAAAIRRAADLAAQP